MFGDNEFGKKMILTGVYAFVTIIIAVGSALGAKSNSSTFFIWTAIIICGIVGGVPSVISWIINHFDFSEPLNHYLKYCKWKPFKKFSEPVLGKDEILLTYINFTGERAAPYKEYIKGVLDGLKFDIMTDAEFAEKQKAQMELNKSRTKSAITIENLILFIKNTGLAFMNFGLILLACAIVIAPILAFCGFPCFIFLAVGSKAFELGAFWLLPLIFTIIGFVLYFIYY